MAGLSLGRLITWVAQVLAQPWVIGGAIVCYTLFDYWPVRYFLLPPVLYGFWIQLVLIEDPVKNPERWSVVIGGAGVSGLCMAVKLKEIGITDITILEKGPSLGGTWADNQYPGVACDVPSHFYSFSNDPNPFWSRLYSNGQEIWRYLNDYCDRNELKPMIKFGHKITTVSWDDGKKRVNVQTECGKVFTANFFIHGTGALHVPNIPEFKGREEFKGPVMHSAQWDTKVKYEGKRVGIIGTGASAVQIVPTVADQVKQLSVFQRTPAWVPERHDMPFSERMKNIFHYAPWTMTAYRYFLFWRNEALYWVAFQTSSPLVGLAKWIFKRMTNKALKGNERLIKDLTPEYQYGCKRITPSDHYLQAFLKDNVHLVTSGIDCFTSKGIVTSDGTEHQLDIIVLATGFNLLNSASAYNGYGQDGVHLQKVWGDAPRAYLGITYPKMPNAFFLLGPATGLGHSSIIYVIECQVNYIADCIRRLSYEDGKVAMACRQSSLDEFVEYVDKHMEGKVFNAGCISWYKNKRGINWTLWPKDLVTYWWATLSCQMERDFILE